MMTIIFIYKTTAELIYLTPRWSTQIYCVDQSGACL